MKKHWLWTFKNVVIEHNPGFCKIVPYECLVWRVGCVHSLTLGAHPKCCRPSSLVWSSTRLSANSFIWPNYYPTLVLTKRATKKHISGKPPGCDLDIQTYILLLQFDFSSFVWSSLCSVWTLGRRLFLSLSTSWRRLKRGLHLCPPHLCPSNLIHILVVLKHRHWTHAVCAHTNQVIVVMLLAWFVKKLFTFLDFCCNIDCCKN